MHPGARLRPHAAGIRGAVNAEIGSSLPGGVTTTISGGTSPGSSITVTVQHNFQTATAIVVPGHTVPLRAAASVVVE